MKPVESLYNQSATHLSLQLFVGRETQVAGRLVVELARIFSEDLLLPGCRPFFLATKRPGVGPRMNMGDFSEQRWAAATEKILAGEYSVVWIRAHFRDFPDRNIELNVQVNPEGGRAMRITGTVEISCSIPYLRQLASSPERIESLLGFGRTVWNGVEGGPAYGFGNIAIILARPPFQPGVPRVPGAPMPWEIIKPPAERVHPVPIAYVGADIDANLEGFYCGDRGIKGAFWANYLSSAHVAMAGGEEVLRTALNGMRVEPLDHGGLLVVVTDSPLPRDTEETRERFLRLTEALQPAFLSRNELPEIKRPMLGYFYRERDGVFP